VSRFFQKAIERLNRLDPMQAGTLMRGLAGENDLLAMVLESMTDGIIVLDEVHAIRLINKAAERLLPFAADELTGRAVWQVVDDEQVAAFLRDTLIGSDHVLDGEFTLEGAHAATLEITIVPLVRDRRIEGSLVHVDDITERRSEEARLRRAESLASMTTLAAGVAHEIRNPLTSMSIHLQLIQRSLSGGQTVPAEIDESLNTMTEEIQRLNKIVVDFLFAVRPMNSELREGDINDVLGPLLAFLRPELSASGIQVVEKLATRLPPAQIDERLLREALLNIVKNAKAAMPVGGTLTVGTALAGERICVTLRDNGTGIPDDITDKIFEPYFTTREFGSGLGLTLTYKIIKEHAGDIEVTSKPGAGTTFRVCIPVSPRARRMLEFQAVAG
jgi:PAS domain S-box-containing protein